ncbi:MAG: hypothetical protein H8E42_00030 [Nitrospinae bacterium]|nr:hypothetical protein [Nitrospinota bacterium]
MSEHKFKAFLRSRKWNENQSKSFVDMALAEPTLPDTVYWEELKEHLEVNKTDAKTIEEVKYIWGFYEDSLHGQKG